MNAKLEESARAEFDDILHERKVVRGLNELDRLVGEAKLRRENGEGANSVPYVELLTPLLPFVGTDSRQGAYFDGERALPGASSTDSSKSAVVSGNSDARSAEKEY